MTEPTPEHLALAREKWPCEWRNDLRPSCDEYMKRAVANPAYAGEGTFAVCASCHTSIRVAALLAEQAESLGSLLADAETERAMSDAYCHDVIAERDSLKAENERLVVELAALTTKLATIDRERDLLREVERLTRERGESE